MHLILPFLSSLLFVTGLLLIKRTANDGVHSLTTLFLSNVFCGLLFSALWLLGGEPVKPGLLWQPAVLACLYLFGLSLTFIAVQRGDVSLATPVFGIKVVFVPLLLAWVWAEPLSTTLWVAAGLAFCGIATIQGTGQGTRRHVWFTLSLATAAAAMYATFDVLVQRWSPVWGTGRLLPLVFWIVALGSLVLVPAVQWEKLRRPHIAGLLFPGAVCVALQSLGIVFTLAMFGDATRVNIVFALRGLWGVLLAWAVARIWGGAEAELSGRQIGQRALGAVMLTVAVTLALSSGS